MLRLGEIGRVGSPESETSSSMFKVSAIHQTCWACPSQWEGKLDDGRGVYIRYRWGDLTIQVGHLPMDLRQWPTILDKDVGDALDGLMGWDEMVSETATVLDFSAVDPTEFYLQEARSYFHWRGMASADPATDREAVFSKAYMDHQQQFIERGLSPLDEATARDIFQGGIDHLSALDHLFAGFRPAENGEADAPLLSGQ